MLTRIAGEPVHVFRSQCILMGDELGVTSKSKSGAFIVRHPDKKRVQSPFLVEVDEALVLLIGFRKTCCIHQDTTYLPTARLRSPGRFVRLTAKRP